MWTLILLQAISATISGLDLRNCNQPLGMTNGRIKDDQLTASSSFDLQSTGPQHSRLQHETGSGAWCPVHQINATNANEWIQVTLSQDTVISAIETQGRWGEGRGMEYPTAYKIEYWRPSIKAWATYHLGDGNMVLKGNTDTRTPVIRELDGGFVARRIRIVPLSNSTRTVCLRFELYGCPFRGSLESYSAPEGSVADGLALKDWSFDGQRSEIGLEAGLGKLYDGFVGHDDFERHPEKWVGWRKEKSSDKYVELTFAFSERRNLSALMIHTANQFRHSASSFTSAEVFFSSDDINYSPRSIRFTYHPDTKFESARWVRIPIPDRIAKFIKVRLYFSDESSWLLISEVKFESNKTSFELSTDDADEHEDTITYYSVEYGDNSHALRFVVTVVLLFLIGISVLVVYVSYRRHNHRVKSSSPPPSVVTMANSIHLTLDGRSVKRASPSTYQIARENAQNALKEKSSDYADPDFSDISSSTLPLLSAFCNPAMDSSHYAATDIVSPVHTLKSNPLSSMVKFSDYGEVYCTTLPEIDRNKLVCIEKIGQGEFGEVHLCQLENRKVAVKRLHGISPEDELAFQREIRVLGTLKHPNVVEVIGVSTIEKPIICIMEYMENGDLKSHLSNIVNLDTPTCISICTQLAAGLAYLESCNFIHRDIAARNCLVDVEGNVKIADFGMSRSLYSCEYYKVEGNFMLPIRWMAWETLLLGKFSTASDVWAFGVTMWEVFMAGREKPFSELNDEDIINNIKHIHATGQRLYTLPKPPLCPPGVYEKLMLRCWMTEPKDRPTFEQLHLFLQTLIHQSI